jgi:hypothetical protein
MQMKLFCAAVIASAAMASSAIAAVTLQYEPAGNLTYKLHNTADNTTVEQTLGLKVFWTLSNDYEAVIRSINQGKPIVLNGSSKYTKDVKALGAKIAGLGGKDRIARPSASRIMGQLVGKIVGKTGESDA